MARADREPKDLSLTPKDSFDKLEKVNVASQLTQRRFGRLAPQIELNFFLEKNPLGVEVSVVANSGDFTFAHYGKDWKGWLIKDDHESSTATEPKYFFVYYLHSGTVGNSDLRSDYQLEELKPNTSTRFFAT